MAIEIIIIVSVGVILVISGGVKLYKTFANKNNSNSNSNSNSGYFMSTDPPPYSWD